MLYITDTGWHLTQICYFACSELSCTSIQTDTTPQYRFITNQTPEELEHCFINHKDIFSPSLVHTPDKKNKTTSLSLTDKQTHDGIDNRWQNQFSHPELWVWCHCRSTPGWCSHWYTATEITPPHYSVVAEFSCSLYTPNLLSLVVGFSYSMKCYDITKSFPDYVEMKWSLFWPKYRRLCLVPLRRNLFSSSW
jgi:hypothetical protein